MDHQEIGTDIKIILTNLQFIVESDQLISLTPRSIKKTLMAFQVLKITEPHQMQLTTLGELPAKELQMLDFQLRTHLKRVSLVQQIKPLIHFQAHPLQLLLQVHLMLMMSMLLLKILHSHQVEVQPKLLD